MKTKIFLVAACAVLLSGCSDWLQVEPENIVTETELFKDGEGFRNALNGVYKQLSQPEMYGQEMTWGTLEAITQTYVRKRMHTSSKYRTAMEFNYTKASIKGDLSSMWTKGYNAVINCNNILQNIEGKNKSMFAGGEVEKNMIKGEALALRAFIHFDLLRLFAPAPIQNNTEAQIPYTDKYPSYGEPSLTLPKFMERVIADLLEARSLVAQFDTVPEHSYWMGSDYRFKPSSTSFNPMPEDIFYGFRGFRMNYAVITSMLARAYNYIGEYRKAYDYATEVIEFTDKDDQNIIQFSDSWYYDENPKLADDLIFALSFLKLEETFKPYTLPSSDTRLIINGGKSIFDDSSDARMTLLGSANNRDFYSTRFFSNGQDWATDIVPIFRLSELYFIRAEYYASLSQWTQAADEIDVVRGARDCTIGQLNISDHTSFCKVLLDEAKRDYLAEGQLFFYYKKFNIPLTKEMKSESFVFPKPDNENIH